jgi:hypothetical protein
MKLDPLCFKEFPMAITNQGFLIPCCYCDDPSTMEDPDFKKLLEVSNIKDYENIEDIIKTKEWTEFAENLKNHKGPRSCIQVCQVRENKNDIIRKDTHIDPKTKTVVGVRDV